MAMLSIIGEQNTARNYRVMELLCHNYNSEIRKNLPLTCRFHEEHCEEVLGLRPPDKGTAVGAIRT